MMNWDLLKPYAIAFVGVLATWIAMWCRTHLPEWVPAEIKGEAFWNGLVLTVGYLIWSAIKGRAQREEVKNRRIGGSGGGFTVGSSVGLGSTVTKITGLVLLAGLIGSSGCASLVNMEMTRRDRNEQIMRVTMMKQGEPAVMFNLMEMANITEAPTWRTLLCGLIDVGTGIGVYAAGEEAGWWGNQDNHQEDKSVGKGNINVTTGNGSPVMILVGGGTGALEATDE
jgi:hypothetical protein